MAFFWRFFIVQKNSIFLDRVRINFLSSSVQVPDIIFLYENLKNRDEVVNFRLEYRKIKKGPILGFQQLFAALVMMAYLSFVTCCVKK